METSIKVFLGAGALIIASFIGSGINGNGLTLDGLDYNATDIASFIGSGINGNKSQTIER